MNVKSISKKFGIVLTSSLLLASATISPIAHANETHHIIRSRQQPITSEKFLALELAGRQDFIIDAIIKDVDDSLAKTGSISQASNLYQERAALGLLATIAGKYGWRWVKYQLPRIIYPHLARYLGKYMTQTAFVNLFANSLSFISGFSIEGLIANTLINWGVNGTIASLAAAIIYQVILWYI